MSDSSELCGVSGADEDFIRKGEFNRLAAAIRYYHFKPLKEDVKEIKESIALLNETVREHIESDKAFFNQLLGAKWAIYAIFGILAFCTPVVYALAKALFITKVL